MGLLGNVGSLYMVILILLLIIGLGSIGLMLIDYLIGFGKGNKKVVSNANVKNNNIKAK